MMNQKKIAEKLGLSQSSISLVLQNPATSRVSEKNKKRIIQCLKSSQYVNSAGYKRTWHIGYITDPLQNLQQDFFQESLRGIEEESARNHYSLILECLRSKKLNLLKNSHVDGLIIRSGKAYEFLQNVHTALPVVLLNCATTITECDSVMPDNRSGIYKALRYLTKKQKNKIAFIGYHSDYSQYSCNYIERQSAFNEGCAYFKLDSLLEIISENPAEQLDIKAKIAQLILRWKKIKNPPQAIICVNYYLAALVQQFWSELEIIAGDSKTDGYLSEQRLPALVQDAAYMGKMATELLLKRIAEPARQHVRINCDMDLYIP